MGRSKIAISVLGNFLEYKEVEYIIESKGDKISNRTKSSIVAIAKTFKVDKVILLLPFSIAAAICPEYILNGDLKNAKDSLSLSAKEFIRGELAEEIEIFTYVLPNIGTFNLGNTTRQIRVSGSRGSFHEAVFLTIYGIIKEIGDFEIYLDVTHAINSLILDAVDSIIRSARTISAISGCNGRVTVYYSDPFVSKSHDKSLNIRVFKRELMDTNASSSALLFSDFIANFDANDYTRAFSEMDVSEPMDPNVLKDIAYYHNLGCVLLTSSLSDILLKWKRQTLSLLKHNCNQPEGSIANEEDNVININLAYKIEREVSTAFSILEIMTSGPFIKGKEPSLVELKFMTKFISDPGCYLIKDEIDHIEKLMKEVKEEKILLKDVYNKYNLTSRVSFSSHSSGECIINKRNFIAHSGLEQNVTWIIKQNNEIRLTYGPCLDKVKKSVRLFK